MLKTPFGDIIVSIDDTDSEYTAVAVPLDHRYDKELSTNNLCNDLKRDII